VKRRQGCFLCAHPSYKAVDCRKNNVCMTPQLPGNMHVVNSSAIAQPSQSVTNVNVPSGRKDVYCTFCFKYGQ